MYIMQELILWDTQLRTDERCNRNPKFSRRFLGVAQPQILSAGDRLGWLSQPRLRSVLKHSFSWEELFVNHLADSGRSKFLCERMTSSKPNSRSKHELSPLFNWDSTILYCNFQIYDFQGLKIQRWPRPQPTLMRRMPWRCHGESTVWNFGDVSGYRWRFITIVIGGIIYIPSGHD